MGENWKNAISSFRLKQFERYESIKESSVGDETLNTIEHQTSYTINLIYYPSLIYKSIRNPEFFLVLFCSVLFSK